MTTPVFVIDGTEYPVPERPSLNLDERVIFYEWTGVSLETIDDTPINDLMVGAFMQMAFMRGNPDVSATVARRIIGKTNFESALAALVASEQEEDADPPELSASVNEQPVSLANSESSPSISGDDSTKSSDTQANGQHASGTRLSAMSVTSGQTRSAS